FTSPRRKRHDIAISRIKDEDEGVGTAVTSGGVGPSQRPGGVFSWRRRRPGSEEMSEALAARVPAGSSISR
ncbi:hypothetical protein GWI33_011249, partial [Rhynchophorus ferrugineus]